MSDAGAPPEVRDLVVRELVPVRRDDGAVVRTARVGLGALTLLSRSMTRPASGPLSRGVPVDGVGSAAVDVVVGAVTVTAAAGASVVRTTGKVLRPVAAVVVRPPLLPESLAPATWLGSLARRGRVERERGVRELAGTTDVMVPAVTAEVLKRIDLTTLVLTQVDLERIIGAALDQMDLTELVLTRVDVEQLVTSVLDDMDLTALVRDHVDVVTLADYVIEEIDLHEIIRASTGSVVSETVRGVRMQSIDADQALARVVDRVLLRRRQRRTDAPGEPESADELRAQGPTDDAHG